MHNGVSWKNQTVTSPCQSSPSLLTSKCVQTIEEMEICEAVFSEDVTRLLTATILM